MAFTAKLVSKLGGKREAVTVSDAPPIFGGGNDAVEVNIDATKMTKSDAVGALGLIVDRIKAGPWPIR